MTATDTTTQDNTTTTGDIPSTTPANYSKEELDKAVADAIALAVGDIKTKLDGAYNARDAALLRVAEIDQKEKDASIQRLKDEGKHKEAADLLVAEANAKREVAEKKAVALTRDVSVRTALSSLEFRNEKSSNMAYSEIISELVQNETGDWVHKSGSSIKEHIANFALNDENSFLFKAKTNSGAGTTQTSTAGTETKPQSLFKLSQAEVLKMAAEGKLN